ncbi:MAG: DUF6268 family outer membrane beta-barrel protein [Phycisphaerales bacterium]|jgi:hypothetical protein|nr:DUF6268 family outer membrane beta-barrel protein [Phycisphaerales bacterium]
MLNIAIAACLFVTTTDTQNSQFSTVLNFHYAHQFEAPIDGGGDIGLSSTGTELIINSGVTDNDDLQFRFQYQNDDWDFSGPSGLGAINPWETITTVDFALQWTHKFNEKSQWFVGGILKTSYEGSFSDGIVAGGTVGVVHAFSDNFTFGVGAGVIQQELDDERLFPVFVLEWKLNETLRITSDITTRFGSRTGAELVWTPRDEWSLGLGFSYGYSRFRLDNSGVAPNGAGEATSWPLTLRATYHASPKFDLTFFGGIVFNGHLDVTNQSSQLVQSRNYDSAGAIGIFGKIKF